MALEIKTYIDNLFAYLDRFENSYEQFETEAFLQTYNGIIAVFQALRQQRNEAIEVDQYFLSKIRQNPLTSSDLRQLTVQVLITFFESEADTDGQSAQAYGHVRGLRPVKQDIPFFENHLVPLLFADGGLNNNFRLRKFLVDEIARYMNKFGRKLQPNLSPEDFQALSDPLKILELARRRRELGEQLIADRDSLEFHLQRIEFFNKLGARNRLLDQFLREWDYIKTTDFWAKVKTAVGELGGKIRGAFSSFGYLRLILTQRNPAYLLYGVVIVLFIFLAIYVPLAWQDHTNDKLHEFQERANTLQSSGK
ncbi:hypothetical protein GF420_03450 [candidate division GN15 bacterium]|nr:hypothetical protein [candidate division GN15 bacterium]